MPCELATSAFPPRLDWAHRMEKSKLRDLIDSTLHKIEPKAGPIGDRVLYGADGLLDSINLVTFLLELEASVQEQFGQRVSLLSDRALSRKVSPFHDAQALVAFVAELLQEGRGA